MRANVARESEGSKTLKNQGGLTIQMQTVCLIMIIIAMIVMIMIAIIMILMIVLKNFSEFKSGIIICNNVAQNPETHIRKKCS